MFLEKLLVILTVITGIFWLINKFHKQINNIKLKEFIDSIGSLFIVFLLVLILRSFVIDHFRIPSGSMRPTLLEGDFILVNKYKYGLKLPIIHTKILSGSSVKRGDVVIFWQEKTKKILIKRVIGLPGDHIVYKSHNLYINNNLIETVDHGIVVDAVDSNRLIHKKTELLENNLAHEIYLNPHDTTSYPFSDIVVGKNSYFVMGDNRNDSMDSRFDGLIDEKDILGKAFFTYLSFDWQNKVFRFGRICKKIQ